MKPLLVVLIGSMLAFAQTHQRAPPAPEPRIDLAQLPARAVERSQSGFALYSVALSWEKEGSRESARAYRDFLNAWSHADASLPQVSAAQSDLASTGRQR